MNAFEVNFDGLVGPTHNYGGLSFGNVASERNLQDVSNPKAAAKQGLLKMKALADRGFKQGVLPPQQRPDLSILRRLGFEGSHAQVMTRAAKQAPELLSAVYSASSMWTANSATVSPSADTRDGRVHFTAANLNAKFHRAIEHPTTTRILQGIFSDQRYFCHHTALPDVSQFGDEGAANHSRFCRNYGDSGLEFFVYGREAFNESALRPKRYPARQTREASQAIARLHGLNSQQVVYAQQSPGIIDEGVFHNDVIAVGNRDVLFYHEAAFVDSDHVLAELDKRLPNTGLRAIRVSRDDVSVQEAVHSYLFNSQLLSLPDDSMMLVVPHECRELKTVSNYLDSLLVAGGPISQIETFDLKQSMKNGGGPACLRLRVVLTDAELAAANPAVMMNDALFASLNQWIDKYYREQISHSDLADVRLYEESIAALEELTGILDLPPVYPFQLLPQ